ncbi:MAG: LacI family DNA-binding transcriptional regulator [Candidatus Choladocola sp.]|nr:LacI family DNA-binding transcriptional regulator [Candidatus Choladocola sp.]
MVTMKDIANRLNLSRCTVSNILNGKLQNKTYKKETIELVLKTAEEMGYVSNTIAQSLKTGMTMTIAVVVPDFANSYYINIVKEIEQLAAKDNYNLIICIAEEKLEKENKILTMLRSRMTDGIIISPISYKESLQDTQGMNIVCFDRKVEGSDIPYIIADNEPATDLMTTRMIEKGVKKPLYIATSDGDYTIRYRVKGFRNALERAGYVVEDRQICYHIYNEKQAYERLIDLVEKQGVFFDGIILSTNYVVYGIKEALQKLRLDIPLAGFDNFAGSNLEKSKMLIASWPEKEIAKNAYEQLYCLMHNREAKSMILHHKMWNGENTESVFQE